MQLSKIKEKWIKENVALEIVADDDQILKFENQYKLKIPHDLRKYFLLLNGMNQDCDQELFSFYPLNSFKNLTHWFELSNHARLPDNLPELEKYFVFADYNLSLFIYAIKLNIELGDNEIIKICGNEYESVSKTFNEFLSIYLENPHQLQF